MANILGYGYVTVKDEDTQKPLKNIYLKNGATWAEVQEAYIKSGNEWIRVFPTPNAVVLLNDSSFTLSTYTTFTSETKTLTIANTGDEVLTITSVDIPVSSKFRARVDLSSLGNTLPYRILPGQTKNVPIFVEGLDVGSDSKTITFNTVTGAYGTNSFTVALNVECLALFSVAVSNVDSLSLRYDNLSTVPTASFSISNNGNGPLTINSITFARLRFTTPPVYVIAPGKTETYNITLTSATQTLIGGFYSDAVTITSDSINGIITIPVTVHIVPHGSITFTANGNWTVPAGIFNPVTIEMQGAPGGAGGNDSAAGGAAGDGGYYKFSIGLTSGLVVESYIGTAGVVGGTTPGSGGSPGGAGGTNSLGYGNGGGGGRAGTSGWSGGGGGGAAATIALVKTGATIIARAFAGGGGGGGGGGNRSLGLPGNTGIGRGQELRAVSLDARWSSFMNNNAVWPLTYGVNESYTIYRSFTATYSGTHYFKFSADNRVTVYVDGVSIGSTTSFTSTTTVARTLTVGEHVIRLDISDSGVAAGVALIITNSSDTSTLFNLRNVLASNVPSPYAHAGEAGQIKSGDGGGAGGGGGGLVAGTRGTVRSGDTGAYGGYRGTSGIDPRYPVSATELQNITKAGSPYIKITW